MNTAVSTPATSTPAAPTGFLNDVLGAGSESPAAAGSAVEMVLEEPPADEPGSLDLEDVSPEVEGPEVKATCDFSVDFLGAPGKKGKRIYVKGSREAAEALFGVTFYRPAGAPPELAEDAPKRRGRKSNASKTLQASPGKDVKALNLFYYDDVGNKAADFADSLYARTKELTIEVHAQNDNGDIVETFRLEDCKALPTLGFCEFFKNQDGRPRQIVIPIEFKSATRISVDPDAEEEVDAE